MRRRKGEVYTFTVEGAGTFPYDMLRYDGCWPYSEGQDSPLLDYHQVSAMPGLRRVVLQSKHEHGPTPRRWESFCWSFVGMGELRDPDECPTPPRGLHR